MDKVTDLFELSQMFMTTVVYVITGTVVKLKEYVWHLMLKAHIYDSTVKSYTVSYCLIEYIVILLASLAKC